MTKPLRGRIEHRLRWCNSGSLNNFSSNYPPNDHMKHENWFGDDRDLCTARNRINKSIAKKAHRGDTPSGRQRQRFGIDSPVPDENDHKKVGESGFFFIPTLSSSIDETEVDNQQYLLVIPQTLLKDACDAARFGHCAEITRYAFVNHEFTCDRSIGGDSTSPKVQSSRGWQGQASVAVLEIHRCGLSLIPSCPRSGSIPTPPRDLLQYTSAQKVSGSNLESDGLMTLSRFAEFERSATKPDIRSVKGKRVDSRLHLHRSAPWRC